VKNAQNIKIWTVHCLPVKHAFSISTLLPVHYLRSLTVLTGTLASCKTAIAKIHTW